MAAEFVFEDKDANLFFKNMLEKLKDIEDGRDTFVSILSTFVFRDVMDHFKKEEGPEGAWPAWDKVYAEHMKKRGRKKKLQDTGFLRNSFQPYKVKKIPDGLMWFNTAPYAKSHDEGIKQKPRPFMWLSQAAADKMSTAVLRYIQSEGG